nr:MAG TPA: hypothetical protein [Bacteriophage sp.]
MIFVKVRKLRSFFIFFCYTFYLVLHVFFSIFLKVEKILAPRIESRS